MSGTRKGFELLRTLPRISLNNLRPNPGAHRACRRGRGLNGGKTHGCGQKGNKQRSNFPLLGAPTLTGEIYHMKFPVQTFNRDSHFKLSYQPLTLQKLQLLVDTDRVRTDVPIDVTQLALTGLYTIDPMNLEGGFIMEDEGMDCFEAQLNMEVQWATEPIIAAIERAGGTITTAYYDPVSLEAAINPKNFFERGIPIPKRMLPPQRLIEYYSNPKNRGYLADPELIAEERFILSQKYGYTLPDLRKSPKCELLLQRKDPRQIFYGLEPGWFVNLTDKVILKPRSQELMEYYIS